MIVEAVRKMTVRRMEPRDLARVWSAARAQNRRDGTSYPVPPVFDLDPASQNYGRLMPNVVLALVTEVEGRVRQGHIWLRTIEEMSFGGGKDVMEFSGAHISMALDILKDKGYDDVHVLVPHVRLAGLKDLLASHGLARIDHRLAHFFRML